ncbi:hypothetical protein CN934_31970 [Ensifer sp. MMN_5]|nr:hypothetical protein CN934_31970 [Ensifer sp. MMN_5]
MDPHAIRALSPEQELTLGAAVLRHAHSCKLAIFSGFPDVAHAARLTLPAKKRVGQELRLRLI